LLVLDQQPTFWKESAKMTENRWPQDGSYGTPGVTEQTAVPVTPATDTAYPATPGTPSKTETAKHEAGDIAHQATDSAQHVAQTAKAEAANVAGEVKANAKDLLYQARTDLTDQAGAQQQKVAQGLHSISGELRTMADASDQPGVATDLIRQAAERSASVASWLEGRDPGSLLNEVKSSPGSAREHS
jgi:cell division septum initiation protein DivIVA